MCHPNMCNDILVYIMYMESAARKLLSTEIESEIMLGQAKDPSSAGFLIPNSFGSLCLAFFLLRFYRNLLLLEC